MSDAISIHAFFGDNYKPNPEYDARQELQDCDIIFGVDVMSGREFIVYGRDALEQIAAGDEAVEAVVMRIAVDQETDELETLLALVVSYRGHEDYQSDTES